MDNLELKMIKAFAKLEGVKLIKDFQCNGYLFIDNEKTFPDYDHYNPIKDLAQNCSARDKYYVDVYHSLNCVNIDDCNDLPFVAYDLQSEISKAVIECILKSKGINYEL